MASDNPLGDLEITDPLTMRALAHPVRLAILSRLQGSGPATATELSPDVGATPSVTSWHLRHLAGFGLVRDSEPGDDRRARRWEAAARGFRFSVPDEDGEADGLTAARMLSQLVFAQAASLPQRWVTETEPQLTGAWRRVAGVSNTRIVITESEADRIAAEIEALLAPFVHRRKADRPADARGVRLLRYLLPEAENE